MAPIENQPILPEDDGSQEKHLVLIGGGHSHVHVLKVIGDQRSTSNKSVRLTVISSVRFTPYSGMLPGYLAGHYTHEQIHLDVLKLTKHAGGRFIHAPAVRVEVNEGGCGGTVYLGPAADGSSDVLNQQPSTTVHYDCLSINIGSSPGAVPSTSVIPVKPISTFCQQYQALLDAVEEHEQATTYRVCVVGGGAGGVELALALQHRLLSTTNLQSLELEIITRSDAVLESHGPAVRRKFQRILRERKITVTTRASVTAVANGDSSTQQRIMLADGTERLVDACFWCATAESAQWLSDATPFACTPTGNFLRVAETYECIGFTGVFAAGDCAYMDAHPRARAGVFAVRAGPILVENILRYLRKEPLIRHRPQERFLQLISTGDQYAVASRYAHVALEGKWLWRLKDRIDRKWMEKYMIAYKQEPESSSSYCKEH